MAAIVVAGSRGGSVTPCLTARVRALLGRFPVSAAVGVSVAWHAILFALADGLPPVSPVWFPDLGPTLVNCGAAVLPIGLALALGWRHSAGLRWRRPDRSWLLLLPLVAEASVYAVHGLPTDLVVLASAAALYAALGMSEEALSRGLVQRLLSPRGPTTAAVLVGVLFGAGHVLSGLWFGRPMDEIGVIAVNATGYGFCLAALRWHLGTIWPLAAVHGLSDFTQILSPGNLPFTLRAVFLLALIGYGAVLLRALPRATVAALPTSSAPDPT